MGIQEISETMRVLILLTIICYSVSALNVDSLRSFCCAFYDAKADCNSRCQGQPCSSRCESRCGLSNTLCGSWPCQEVNSSGCTTDHHNDNYNRCSLNMCIVWSYMLS